MALTIQWEGGDGTTVISSGSYIGFYGSTFNSSIPLSNYNDITVATNATGTINNGSLPNVKYTSPGYATWVNPTNGTNSGSISGVSFDDCTLHIRITSGSSFRLSSVNLIAFSDNDLSKGPADITVVGFEQGSSNWTYMSGSGAPLALTPHISSGSAVHDYYICLSASPIAIGASTQVSLGLTANWY